MSEARRLFALPSLIGAVSLISACTSASNPEPRTNPGADSGRGGATSSGGSSGGTQETGGQANAGTGGDVNGGAGNGGQGSGGTASQWELIWSDEFDKGSAPDPDKWKYDVRPPGWVNEELQNYVKDRPENARIENGVLILEAHRDNFEGHEYSSARINTHRKFDFLYGRVEASARVPSGRGTWPAIWMMPVEQTYGSWPNSGEIDIMEHVGYDPGVIHASTHCAKYYWKNNNQKTATLKVPDATTNFHVYAVEWYADRIDAFVDDKLYFSVKDEGSGWQAWPFDKNFHIIMNLAVGGVWGGAKGVDTTVFPQRLEVDYVRVYRAK